MSCCGSCAKGAGCSGSVGLGRTAVGALPITTRKYGIPVTNLEVGLQGK